MMEIKVENTPEASNSHSKTYTRREIFDCARTVRTKNTKTQIAAVVSKLSKDIGSPFQLTVTNEKQLRLILSKLWIRWNQAQRTRRFFDKNKQWLDGTITFVNGPAEQQSRQTAKRKKSGRNRSSFDYPSDRTEHRIKEEPISISDLDCEISADVALNFIISGKMSKATYLMVRDLTNKSCRTSVYPSYAKLLSAKKRCYPPKSSITITETTAEVQLQSLLNHISERLTEMANMKITAMDSDFLNNCILTCKWGCDRSTGQGYRKKFPNENSSDEDVIFTSVVPLELTAMSDKSNKIVVWRNPMPSSMRFCRPLRLQFLKDTTDYNIQDEKQYFDNQIKYLVPFHIVVNGRNVMVKYNLIFTMVGEVKNEVSDAETHTLSTQPCYICKQTSNKFNNIDLLVEKEIDCANLTLGVSSLHAWIRFMEWFLDLAYKNSDDETEKKWQARSEKQKQRIEARKAKIQSEFENIFGILIDDPGSGSGTTNDDTARRFFEDVPLTATILGIDEELMAKCKVILQTMLSGCAIDVEKFKTYCLNVARRYVDLYSWYPMPTSVHIVLMHGYAIIEAAPLPIGRLSEEAQKAWNKDIRRYREDFTYNCSREKTMHDVFHRFLATSDPLISSFQEITGADGKQLSPEVKDLLFESSPSGQPDSNCFNSNNEVTDDWDDWDYGSD